MWGGGRGEDVCLTEEGSWVGLEGGVAVGGLGDGLILRFEFFFFFFFFFENSVLKNNFFTHLFLNISF